MIATAKAIAILALGAGYASAFSLSMSSALIVQNKGGGHGELGFQLAKNLSSNPKITSITILQDSACNDAKHPFASYASDIPNVKIVKADLADESMTAAMVQSLLGESYDYVWDNASKGAVGAGKAVVDCAKEWNSKLLTYVSSAGIYKPDNVFPMPETTAVKDIAGQVLYEQYAKENGLPFVSFRPQYIYGEKSNKWDYIDYFFDRLVRKEPVPIPSDGSQKVSLTNSADVASLLASVLNDEAAAVGQTYFNCGTDQLLTYDKVALMCAEVAGVDANIHHFDPALGKAAFPFRMTDFYVSPDMAKSKLGWEGPKHNLKDDLAWYFESYKARGGMTKDLDLSKDKEVLAPSSV
ncbi:hypothetical protein ACHAWO_005762 [Cyclotella atomus]|uniref:NAD-dependent epimerase/dehydratase domain-containing protein n=1 Tax=Cyclotella atomus TaxID=382360 RepID=A0ABD3P3B5_9STRA